MTQEPAAHSSADAAGGGAIVLMYHALQADGRTPDGEDPHYTLTQAQFIEHLRLIAEAGGGGCARDWLLHGQRRHRTLLTFDDGHVSNHAIAMPALLEHGMRADFFVNPINVGRPGFASWAQLREMADAGMSIQSHGFEHVYLTRYDAAGLRDNLRRSRQQIEDGVGHPVTLLAPPGGRMPPGLAAVARECGYRHVLSSRPGRITRADAMILPRMSVTAATATTQLRDWLLAGRRGVLREQLRYAALATAKRLLGDARYERLRHRALSAEGE